MKRPDVNELYAIARVYPNAAVIHRWIEYVEFVERELKKAADAKGAEGKTPIEE